MKSYSQRGKRNRERGMELQREIVKFAKKCNLDAYNRDRGGAQFEKGDLEIEGLYYGCKRKNKIAKYLKPEKQEIGVFIREDRGQTLAVVPASFLISILTIAKTFKGEK